MRARIIFFVLLILLATGGYFWWQGQHKTAEPKYETATVDRAAITQTVSASGTLNPVKLVNVGTQISGVVRVLHADFNDTVTQDQILAELDQSLLKAQLQQSQANLASAEAALRNARLTYDRNLTLFKQDFIPKADLDKAQTDMDTARAQVIAARGQVSRDQVNIGYSVIRSPVSGVIVSRAIDVGQTVAASFQTPTLFTIAQDLKAMQIDTSLSEADVGAVKAGMKARFTVDAFPDRHFEGIVRQVRLNPTTVQNVVTYNVVIDVSNDDLVLLPGMTAFVTIIESEKNDVLRVPNDALNFKPAERIARKPDASANPNAMPVQAGNIADTATRQTTGEQPAKMNAQVYVLENNRPKSVPITIGMSDSKFTEIVAGNLKEGDSVIIDETGGARKPGGGPGGGRGGMGGPRLF